MPLAAGGMADILARVIAAEAHRGAATPPWSRTAPAASGVIGADAVAKSPPDGYTLLMGLHATQAILVHLQPSCPTIRRRILRRSSTSATRAERAAGAPIRCRPSSLSELIAYAKANPGKLTFASQGNGSTGHMIGEQFKRMAGIDLTHVPYRGAAPASQDLLAGHVSMLFDIVPLAVSQSAERQGARACGVLAGAREGASRRADHRGGRPSRHGGRRLVRAVRAGRHAAGRHRLAESVRRGRPLRRRKCATRFCRAGRHAAARRTPEAFGAHVAAETERWGALISRAGIRME